MVDIVPVEGCGKFKGCRMISNELKKGEACKLTLRSILCLGYLVSSHILSGFVMDVVFEES